MKSLTLSEGTTSSKSLEPACEDSISWESRSKMLLFKKKPTDSIMKNFGLIIYLLYYRYKVELGISVLTPTESFIVNIIILFFVFSIWNQGILFLFDTFMWSYKFIKSCLYVYNHMEQFQL